ncbi:MAG: transglycosylase SLT domain-containing protein [Candidatus Binatia bacterium]|nr:transglycosylase SLT domain-containing protein [Candidatus Binatia bacterium]
MPWSNYRSVWFPFVVGNVAAGALAWVLWPRLLLTRNPPVPDDFRQPRELSRGGPSAAGAAPRWVIGLDGWQIAVEGAELALLPPSAFRGEQRQHQEQWVDPGLSPYDQWIVSYAHSAGLDWELIAAIIAEESGFDAGAVSERGAVGLMQVRPVAAAQVGEAEFADPESNIRTGVRYLVHLNELFADVVTAERLPFVLAAYNMGPAHVRDAQELARRLGFDPRRWQGHVARVLPLLEEEPFYRTLPAGYAQGRRVLEYVARVLARYDELVRSGKGQGLPAGLGHAG